METAYGHRALIRSRVDYADTFRRFHAPGP